MSREVSAIINADGMPISMTLGTFASVDFDITNLTKWHMQFPNSWHLLHSHPEGLSTMSSIDAKLVRGVTSMISPHTLFFWIVTKDRLTLYKCWMESKQEWLERKNNDSNKKRKLFVSELGREQINHILDSMMILAYTIDNIMNISYLQAPLYEKLEMGIHSEKVYDAEYYRGLKNKLFRFTKNIGECDIPDFIPKGTIFKILNVEHTYVVGMIINQPNIPLSLYGGMVKIEPLSRLSEDCEEVKQQPKLSSSSEGV